MKGRGLTSQASGRGGERTEERGRGELAPKPKTTNFAHDWI